MISNGVFGRPQPAVAGGVSVVRDAAERRDGPRPASDPLPGGFVPALAARLAARATRGPRRARPSTSAAFCRPLVPDGVELLAVRDGGAIAPMHTHDEHALYLSDTGSFEVRLPTGRIVGGPEVIVAVAAGVPHTMAPAGPNRAGYLAVLASGPALSIARGHETAPLRRCRALTDPDLARSLAAAHAGLMAAPDSRRHGDLLGALLGAAFRPDDEPEDHAAEPEPRRIRAVREHLASRLTDPARLDDLSDLVGVSPFYLQRTFKASTGMSPREYLLDLRIRRARALLREGRLPRAVSGLVGFFDQSHFTRAFRRLTGVTPGVFASGTTASRTGIA